MMSPTSLASTDRPDISVPDGPETVFVVDDEPEMAKGMQALLERAGYDIASPSRKRPWRR